MPVLITGATGFAGRHLLAHLSAQHPDLALHATSLGGDPPIETPQVQVHTVNLIDRDQVRDLIEHVRPRQIYHLAAQSSPRYSFVDPWATLENNIRAELNLFLACLDLHFAPRILVVSSAEIYQPSDQAIDEDSPFLPTNPYSVSKISQDMLALQYFVTHKLPIMRARPFNHTGPGQREGFVASDFAMQIARIEAGQQDAVMQVGNLEAKRDFSDVRDVVRAYRLILEEGEPGTAYNVAAGQAYSIQHLLDTLLSFSSSAIEVQTDPSRFLPVDVPIKVGDNQRLMQTTGWRPEISFEQTLHDLLDDCRHRSTQ